MATEVVARNSGPRDDSSVTSAPDTVRSGTIHDAELMVQIARKLIASSEVAPKELSAQSECV